MIKQTHRERLSFFARKYSQTHIHNLLGQREDNHEISLLEHLVTHLRKDDVIKMYAYMLWELKSPQLLPWVRCSWSICHLLMIDLDILPRLQIVPILNASDGD